MKNILITLLLINCLHLSAQINKIKTTNSAIIYGGNITNIEDIAYIEDTHYQFKENFGELRKMELIDIDAFYYNINGYPVTSRNALNISSKEEKARVWYYSYATKINYDVSGNISEIFLTKGGGNLV